MRGARVGLRFLRASFFRTGAAEAYSAEALLPEQPNLLLVSLNLGLKVDIPGLIVAPVQIHLFDPGVLPE
eukprot:7104741-Heterocapsa_arctica.AAC.1